MAKTIAMLGSQVLESLQTRPTRSRKFVAALLVAGCLCWALMDKIAREFGTGLTIVPVGLSGSWPNFSVTLAVPILLFVTNSRMPYGDFVKVSFGNSVGMSVYEIAQIWLPRRTFDWADIVASFAGALLCVCIVRIAFYRKAET